MDWTKTTSSTVWHVIKRTRFVVGPSNEKRKDRDLWVMHWACVLNAQNKKQPWCKGLWLLEWVTVTLFSAFCCREMHGRFFQFHQCRESLPALSASVFWTFSLNLCFRLSISCCKHIVNTKLNVGDARGDYYGESAGSYMVKEFKWVVAFFLFVASKSLRSVLLLFVTTKLGGPTRRDCQAGSHAATGK